MILSIAAEVTGMPHLKDNAICEMYAAVLQLYSYLLMHQDWWEVSFTPVNMDEMFERWSDSYALPCQSAAEVEAAQQGGDVSKETVAKFLKFTMHCPCDKEVFRPKVANSNQEFTHFLCLFGTGAILAVNLHTGIARKGGTGYRECWMLLNARECL